MNLSHSTAFQWLQKEKDGRLEESERIQLEQHLAACPECRMYADTAGQLERTAATRAPVKINGRSSDRQMASAVLHQLQRRKAILKPLQEFAWVALALLLVWFTGWSIESLRPQEIGAAPLPLEQSGPLLLPGPFSTSPQPAEPIPPSFDWFVLFNNLFQRIGVYTYLVGALFLLLMAGISFYLGSRQADTLWYGLLLCTLLGSILMTHIVAVQPAVSGISGFLLIIFILPVLISASALLSIHLLEIRSLWTPLNMTILVFCLGLLIIFLAGPWWSTGSTLVTPIITILILLIFGMAPALTWRAWEWKGRWRWVGRIALCLLLAVLALSFLPESPQLLRRAPWMGGIFNFSFVWGLFAVVLAGRLFAAWLFSASPPSGRSFWLGALLVGILFISQYANLRLVAIRNTTSEDQILGAFGLMFVIIAGLAAASAVIWKHSNRQAWAIVGLILLFCVGQIPAISIPNELYIEVTRRGAGQINAAILQFHSQNGRYPSTLDELTPRYLLLIPEPVTYYRKTWCYDGGQGYYRLGYYSNDRYVPEWDTKTIAIFASAGQPPNQQVPCK